MSGKKVIPVRLSITDDDSKILGKTTEKRREKAAPPPQYDTLKMKTLNSSWTPVVHKPSNDQIFKERRELVSHWFDLWTDSQRKRFLDVIFLQCTKSQYRFIQQWFCENVPLQHIDFSVVLPRFLSLYIFSFLDPMTLLRCAQVSWHWRFLSEQDAIWMPKCTRNGWFLQYIPPDNEYGAWKRFYVCCLESLDFNVHSGEKTDLYGFRSVVTTIKKHAKSRRKGPLTEEESQLVRFSRPPWQGPDVKPKDLAKSQEALLYGYNPNDPKLPASMMTLHNRWGIVKKRHEQAVARSMNVIETGLSTHKRREHHRSLSNGNTLERRTQPMMLSESVDLVNMEEQRLQDMKERPWLAPGKSLHNIGEMQYPASVRFPKHSGVAPAISNPRVIFISSRVPAADLLLDAVSFGVIPIVYEFEGSTLDGLLFRLKTVLNGRLAQSIGLFCHGDELGELPVVHGNVIDLETLDFYKAREFFEEAAKQIVSVDENGQFDIFPPLAACEEGMELLIRLSELTGMQFSSPTGLIGSYNHVNTEWLIKQKITPNKEVSPVDVYFCESKLNVWANVADQAVDAMYYCRNNMKNYFDKTQKDVAAQLTGQILFDVLGMTDVQGMNDITAPLVEGIRNLGYQKNVNPLEYLGTYLLEKAGAAHFTAPLSPGKAKPLSSTISGFGDIDEYVETLADTPRAQEAYQEEEIAYEQDFDNTGEEREEEDVHKTARDEDQDIDEMEGLKDRGNEKEDRLKKPTKHVTIKTQNLSIRFGTMRTGRFQRLTPKQFTHHPEKRTPIAQEILTSELEYSKLLQAIKDIYYKPLKSALLTNRAIISNQNLQIIFADVIQMLGLSKELSGDLMSRCGDWNAQQSCLGDIFVKFSARLKVYSNFVNNYDVILKCIERCKEQTPAFRAFLKRHERIPETKMMTLQELLLLPARRIGEYVALLKWFELHTPRMHQDREDISDAIETLKIMFGVIRECKTRMESDRVLSALTKKIINCPALAEANRYLLKHLDCAHLQASKQGVTHEITVFQHTAMFGLYLFNDALMITKRTSQHFPFSRAVEYIYKFDSSISLVNLKVEALPDSRYLRNAFKMSTPKREWICSADTPEDQVNWVSLLEETICGAIEER